MGEAAFLCEEFVALCFEQGAGIELAIQCTIDARYSGIAVGVSRVDVGCELDVLNTIIVCPDVGVWWIPLFDDVVIGVVWCQAGSGPNVRQACDPRRAIG